MSFLTWRWDLPQKEQRSCSLESVGRAMGSVLVDHPVNDAVGLRLVAAQEVIALGIGPNLLVRLLRVLGDDLVQSSADVDDLFSVDLDIGRLALETARDLVDEDLRVGQRHA